MVELKAGEGAVVRHLGEVVGGELGSEGLGAGVNPFKDLAVEAQDLGLKLGMHIIDIIAVVTTVFTA